jgi:hypothetical protein
MKFAVLNPDADALALTKALVADGGHELVSYFSSEPLAVAVFKEIAPEARRIDEWEGVLAGSVQAVVVGLAGPAEPRFEQLRRLVLESVPFVFTHPFGLAPLEYHELDMNRQATASAIVPYEPERHHSAVALLAALGGDEGIGRIEQMTIERETRTRTRVASLTHFVRDLGLARRIAGTCDKVSALGKFGGEPNDDSPTSRSEGGHLGVQITTTDGILIRWSIGPVVERNGAKLTLVGASGSAVVTIPESGAWELAVRRGDVAEQESFAPDDAVKSGAAAVAAAIEATDDALWREALADLELVEAVERSMRKGRTVELFHEEASEEGTFHGVMAAGGCLLMMLAIGLAITATVFGRFRFQIANLWPYALLVLLGAFLIMQFLKLVFPPEKQDD